MSKSLEIWKLLREYIDKNTTWYLKEKTHIETVEGQPLDDIENSLKALEIIKEKKVDLEYLKCCETYEQYKTICSYWNEITQKEYDLLKEVLL